MRDTIYRDEAIDAVTKNACAAVFYNSDNTGVLDILEALPSAEIPTTGEKHQLSAETPTDLISKADAIKKIKESLKWIDDNMSQDDAEDEAHDIGFYGALISMERMINELPSAEAIPLSVADKIGEERERLEDKVAELEEHLAEAVQGWIPCSERLPDDIRPVLVTWKNNDPASYYQYIVGKHYIGTAHYHRGKWYWYSSVTEDLLAEYGKCDSEEFDEAIEAVAWMPLPKPWKGADDDN